jgi:hypothetical protein
MLVKSLDELADLRGQRNAAAELRLPPAFWYLALALIAITVALSTMLKPEVFRVISISAQGLAFALLAAPADDGRTGRAATVRAAILLDLNPSAAGRQAGLQLDEGKDDRVIGTGSG